MLLDGICEKKGHREESMEVRKTKERCMGER